MIHVDIYVPVLDRTYDFCLDDRIPVSAVIEEAAGMICQRERWPAPGQTEALTLSSPRLGRALGGGETLRQAGVSTGSRLILC